MKTHTTSFKRLVAALAILGLVVTSCSKSDGLPTSQSEQSRAHRSGGGSSSGDASVPAPTGLSASATGASVYLSWNSVANATSYWVYRNNTMIAIVTSTNYTDNYPLSGTNTYAVASVINSTLGQKSGSVSVTTP